MNHVMAVIYNYIFSLFQYFLTSWPISIIYGKVNKEPSPETREDLLEAIHQLQDETVPEKDILALMKNLPPDEYQLHVVDEISGYDILQHSIVRGFSKSVKMLLSRKCNLDWYHCTPPVQLAAYLGDVNILQLLLDAGADISKSCGMCYPDPHLPIRYSRSYLGFTQSPVYKCHKHSASPISCAILKNNVECLKVLLNVSSPNKKLPSPLNLLLEACQSGAYDVMKFLIWKYPGYINQYGCEGDTPLLTAVPWGRECVKLLLDNGADVHQLSKGIKETALHRLYRASSDGLFTIYDTTKYLLTTGMEQDINSMTSLGESSLHMLISHVSYVGGNFEDPSQKLPRSQLQGDYKEQVIRTCRILLEFNADPHLLNAYGLTPLSRLLHIALKSSNKTLNQDCVQTASFDYVIVDYRNDFNSLGRAMDILLEFGSDVNFTCSEGHTPLICLLQCLLYEDLKLVCDQAVDIVNCIEILLKHDAHVNFTTDSNVTCATLLAAVCQRFFDLENDLGDELPEELRIDFAKMMNEVLMVLLRYGMDPNHTSPKVSQYPKGGTGNALIEFVRLTTHATSTKDFSVILMWLKTLLQWGADADIAPYPSEPVIVHCQSSIYLKRHNTQPVSHYITEVKERETLFSDGRAEELLLLFYNCMEHQTLFACLNTAKSMVRFHLFNDNRKDFLSLINRLTEHPRSLRQMARLSIYKSLNMNIAKNVDYLPLPGALKQYLLNINQV